MIKIIINKDIVSQYNNYYLSQSARRKVKPISSPIPPSLNTFTSWVRNKQNNEKRKWNSFIVWLCGYLDISGSNIGPCTVHIHYTFPTKIRHDADNYCMGMKFIGDALTECGVIEDDNFEYITELKITGGYLKNNPQTIITIKEI